MAENQKTGGVGVIRFNPWGKMERDTEGAFVLYTDYVALEARCTELESNYSSAVMGEIEATERAGKAEAELATLRARIEREPVVKTLEWSKDPIGGQQALAAGLARYVIHPNGEDWYIAPDWMGTGGKAAAQSDYERRISSALASNK